MGGGNTVWVAAASATSNDQASREKKKFVFSTLHWHLLALSIVGNKHRANTRLILQQRCAHSWSMGGLASRLDTLKSIKKLSDMGNEVKSKKISADRAHAIVMEDIAAEDWHEELLVTVTRVNAFSLDTRKRSKISSPHFPRLHQVIEEAELDKAWDLNAAEDAPTEALVDHEEEHDGSE
jgi:hypothetical protein